MHTNKTELALRHKLKAQMKGQWLLTWHEDRHINPGVPDASFVMKGAGLNGKGHETGWMELKAIHGLDSVGMARFKVEPSQIEWVRNHGELIPCFFLVAAGDVWWLMDWTWHSSLANIHDSHLFQYCAAHGTLGTLGDVLPGVLSQLTSR